MIISPGRGYIFVHIPKTGGTSLALALEARAMKDDLLIGDTPKARRRRGRLKDLTPRGRLWKHSRLSDIEGVLTRDQIHGLRIVTLTRNPWDRMVSYYHWLQTQTFRHPAILRAQTHEFAEFLRHPDTVAEMTGDGLEAYLRLSDGTMPDALILRLDVIMEDLPKLEAVLGVRLEMPHANASVRPRDYRPFFDADTRALVAQAFAADIERVGWRF